MSPRQSTRPSCSSKKMVRLVLRRAEGVAFPYARKARSWQVKQKNRDRSDKALSFVSVRWNVPWASGRRDVVIFQRWLDRISLYTVLGNCAFLNYFCVTGFRRIRRGRSVHETGGPVRSTVERTASGQFRELGRIERHRFVDPLHIIRLGAALPHLLT